MTKFAGSRSRTLLAHQRDSDLIMAAWERDDIMSGPSPGGPARRAAMMPNEQARTNHDELFPGHVSTLAVTDPELIEVFDNFAFDEVHSHGVIDARTRLL